MAYNDDDYEENSYSDSEHKSPWEQAQDEGRLDEFERFTNDLYGGGRQSFSGIDLYDPSTYGPPDPSSHRAWDERLPGIPGTSPSFDGRPRYLPDRPPMRGFNINMPGMPEWNAPGLPTIDPFQAPDPFAAPNPQEIFNDPTYGMRESEGRRALEQSAAAGGVLRTGGTLKDLIKYGQQFASNEYGAVYNRAADVYDRNFRNLLSTWESNRGLAFDRYHAELQGMLPGFQAEMEGYRSSVQAEIERARSEYQREWDAYQQDLDSARWEWEFGLDAAGQE